MTITHHAISSDDRATMDAVRGYLAGSSKLTLGPEARSGYDAMVATTPMAESLTFEAVTVGGVPGWWIRPQARADEDGVILYLHGGAYVLGSAQAYRGLAGQIAARVGVSTFVVDYRLAPEQPFPAAIDDALAVLEDLSRGYRRVALVGDSAGGGLALALLAQAAGPSVAGALLMSPWSDLSLSGLSMMTQAAADPLLEQAVLAEAARLYLGGVDPWDPRASPVYADFAGMPPVLIHVGEDEVLLDDARRVAERIEAARGTVALHVWEGMVHVFPANLTLAAARSALDSSGAFLRTCLWPGR